MQEVADKKELNPRFPTCVFIGHELRAAPALPPTYAAFALKTDKVSSGTALDGLNSPIQGLTNDAFGIATPK